MTVIEFVRRTGSDLERIDLERAAAVLPIGALEFHGPHLPLGTDGYLAETVCRAAANATSSVLLPTHWIGTGLMPKPFSVGLSPATAMAAIAELSADLIRVGFAGAIVVSGHYSFVQRAMLARLQTAMLDARMNIHLMTLPDLLSEPTNRFFDHAGLIESSMMLASHSELTHLEEVATQAADTWQNAFLEYGISGDWPVGSTFEKGEALTATMAKQLASIIEDVRAGGEFAKEASADRVDDTVTRLGRISPVYREWIQDGTGDVEEIWEGPFREVDGESGWFRCC